MSLAFSQTCAMASISWGVAPGYVDSGLRPIAGCNRCTVQEAGSPCEWAHPWHGFVHYNRLRMTEPFTVPASREWWPSSSLLPFLLLCSLPRSGYTPQPRVAAQQRTLGSVPIFTRYAEGVSQRDTSATRDATRGLLRPRWPPVSWPPYGSPAPSCAVPHPGCAAAQRPLGCGV